MYAKCVHFTVSKIYLNTINTYCTQQYVYLGVKYTDICNLTLKSIKIIGLING